MKRYYVSVTEHLNKVVSVDAESEEEAVKKTQKAYDNCNIVLDSNNFVDEEIELDSNQELYADNEKSREEMFISTSTSQTGRAISLPITKTS